MDLLRHPVIDRWHRCMEQLDEPCSLSIIASDTLVSCIQEAIRQAEDAVREECARKADKHNEECENGDCGVPIAHAIREGKT